MDMGRLCGQPLALPDVNRRGRLRGHLRAVNQLLASAYPRVRGPRAQDWLKESRRFKIGSGWHCRLLGSQLPSSCKPTSGSWLRAVFSKNFSWSVCNRRPACGVNADVRHPLRLDLRTARPRKPINADSIVEGSGTAASPTRGPWP